ncbi:MAG: hypothetical protein QM756_36425 [Polyangiaceae bacterium]
MEAVSLFTTLVLWSLLHRIVVGAESSWDLLMLRAAKDFRAIEWALLLLACAGCARALWKREPRVLAQLQAWSLAAGLLLVLYRLGGEAGKKVDLRFAFAVVAAAAALHACYLCLLTRVLVALRSRRGTMSKRE